MFKSILYIIKNAKSRSKRIIPIGKQSVSIFPQKISIQNFENKKQTVDISNIQWESMNLEELSKLDAQTISQIQYNLNKTRSPLNKKISTVQPFQQLPFHSTIKTILKTLNNQIQGPQQKPGKFSELYDLKLQDNQEIISLIERTYLGLGDPSKLINQLEPSFIKYLIGLNNDLYKIGLQLKQTKVNVQSIKPINIQYEFSAGTFRNRGKNAGPDQFIIYEKKVPNPNKSLLILKQKKNQEINLRYLIKKRRPKDCKYELRIQALLQCILSGKKHYIKIQFNSGQEINTNAIVTDPEYRIVDIDNLMKGNPTIGRLFKF